MGSRRKRGEESSNFGFQDVGLLGNLGMCVITAINDNQHNT